MNIILYILIFIIGVLFGGFCATAVWRIPQKMNIMRIRSYCPECRHRLAWWESIPILSYMFLGGKCRNCKAKIKPRYLIYEVLSGIIFVLLALTLNLSMENITLNLCLGLLFLALYLGAIFIIGGIDAENKSIDKNVIYYTLIILILYIIYLCIADTSDALFRYMLYLIVIVILLIADTLRLKNKAKNSYTLSILILAFVMVIFTGEVSTIWAIIGTLLITAIMIILKNIKLKRNSIKKERESITKDLPIGSYLCITNIISLVVVMFLNNM